MNHFFVQRFPSWRERRDEGGNIETRKLNDHPYHDRKMGKMGIVMAFYDIDERNATCRKKTERFWRLNISHKRPFEESLGSLAQ